MASLDETSAPNDGERQAAIAFTSTPTTTEQPRAGIDWNGPMGFWIALPATIAAVTALGILLQ